MSAAAPAAAMMPAECGSATRAVHHQPRQCCRHCPRERLPRHHRRHFHPSRPARHHPLLRRRRHPC
eukprot:4535019-Prymnesium_polylepis.1